MVGSDTKQRITFSTPVNVKFIVADVDQLNERHQVTVYDENNNIVLNPENYIRTSAKGTSGNYPNGTPTTFNDLGSNVVIDGTINDNFVELRQPVNLQNDTFHRANSVLFDFSKDFF